MLLADQIALGERDDRSVALDDQNERVIVDQFFGERFAVPLLDRIVDGILVEKVGVGRSERLTGDRADCIDVRLGGLTDVHA